MRASRFDQSRLKAFVQSSCFARNKAQGWRIYWGAKNWFGAPSFTDRLNLSVPYLSNLYLFTSEDSGDGTVRYTWQAVADRFGNGPRFTDLGSAPSTYVVDVFGSSPQKLYSSFEETGSHAPPGGLTGFNDAFGPNARLEVTAGDTLYQVKVYGPAGDPSEHLLSTYTFTLGSAYSMADAFGEAIATARGGPAIGAGQGKSGCYDESTGGTNFGERGPFVPIAVRPENGAFWYVGWKDHRDIKSDPNKHWPRSINPPDASNVWTGAQLHTTFPITDGAFTGDLGTSVFSNPLGGYLVSYWSAPIMVYSNLNALHVEVMCSTISGSGALATYAYIPSLGDVNPKAAFRLLSVADVALNNADLDPPFFVPTRANGIEAKWQVFFPGRRASEIGKPYEVWH